MKTLEQRIKERIEQIALDKSASPSDWRWIEGYMIEGYKIAMEEYRTQCDELSEDYFSYWLEDKTPDYFGTISCEAYGRGFLKMRSLASPIIASKDARIRELEEEKRRLEDDLGQKSMYYPDEPKN